MAESIEDSKVDNAILNEVHYFVNEHYDILKDNFDLITKLIKNTNNKKDLDKKIQSERYKKILPDYFKVNLEINEISFREGINYDFHLEFNIQKPKNVLIEITFDFDDYGREVRIYINNTYYSLMHYHVPDNVVIGKDKYKIDKIIINLGLLPSKFYYELFEFIKIIDNNLYLSISNRYKLIIHELFEK